MPASTTVDSNLNLETINRDLVHVDAQEVVQWAASTFGLGLVLSSSFGAQAAVMLHLVTRIVADIPVIFVDTGYLFPETYWFAEALKRRLKLNLKTYQSPVSPARQEAIDGRLWEQGESGLDQYNQVRKVEPIQRALRELRATAWLAGLRADQTDHRATLRTVEFQNGVYKVHPILRWSGSDVEAYLKAHDLPVHPLVERGYRSIGDTHTTVTVSDQAHDRSGRFGGLKQECGLHLPASQEESQSRDASGL